MTPVCDIVIVNWNSGDDLSSCLSSLERNRAYHYRFGKIVVVDNASSDGSQKLNADLKLPVELLCNLKNEGFARASNLGAAAGTGSHILFLNPDIVVDENCLDNLFGWIAEDGQRARAIVGIRLVDAAGQTSVTCSRFPTVQSVIAKAFGLEKLSSSFEMSQPMLEFNHSQTRSVDQVMGAFFLVPRELYQDLNGFCEDFFLYYEEVDFCQRSASRGHQAIFYADVAATHIGGASSRKIPARRLEWNLESRLRYYRKHFRLPGYILASGVTLFIEPLTRMSWSLLTGRFSTAMHVLQAYWGIYTRPLSSTARRH